MKRRPRYCTGGLASADWPPVHASDSRTRKRLERERLEMVRLSDAGWSVPKIARHLRFHEQRVRAWIKAYLGGGFDALDDRPHVGQSSAITPDILAQVRRWTQSPVDTNRRAHLEGPSDRRRGGPRLRPGPLPRPVATPAQAGGLHLLAHPVSAPSAVCDTNRSPNSFRSPNLSFVWRVGAVPSSIGRAGSGSALWGWWWTTIPSTSVKWLKRPCRSWRRRASTLGLSHFA